MVRSWPRQRSSKEGSTCGPKATCTRLETRLLCHLRSRSTSPRRKRNPGVRSVTRSTSRLCGGFSLSSPTQQSRISTMDFVPSRCSRYVARALTVSVSSAATDRSCRWSLLSGKPHPQGADPCASAKCFAAFENQRRTGAAPPANGRMARCGAECERSDDGSEWELAM